MITAILVLVIIVGLVYVYFNRQKGGPITHKIDPIAQEQYDKAHSKQDDKKNLSLQEKIERSWQFLYNITKTILTSFSVEDTKSLQEAGTVLRKNGMHYHHNIDQETAIIVQQELSKVVEKEKDTGRSI
jgi:hypothetical protein